MSSMTKIQVEGIEYDIRDESIPSWARADSKPEYTAEEVGALSKDTKISQLENDAEYITKEDIPSKVSYFENDAGYITEEEVDFDKPIGSENLLNNSETLFGMFLYQSSDDYSLSFNDIQLSFDGENLVTLIE